MLSIIISSYQPEYFAALEKNIAETCGIPYEIIKIDNPGIMGICEAYNKGAEKAKFDNLLFLHEDVKFHSKNWGKILSNYYNLPDLGVFGLAGNIRKFHLPYGFHSGLPKEGYMYLYHSGDKIQPFYTEKKSLQKVKVIDGVFIGMRKDVWRAVKFNETIKGYHFYDIDISLRTSEKYQNYLITEIIFEHYSKGNFGNEWIKACLKFNRLEGYAYNENLTPKEKRDIRNFWYKRLKEENINFTNRLSYALALGTNKDTLKNFLKFIFKK